MAYVVVTSYCFFNKNIIYYLVFEFKIIELDNDVCSILASGPLRTDQNEISS